MLKLFNTLSRELEEFKSIKPGEVGMYTCGPTVYNYAHIGNFRSYIFSDILKRVLLMNNYKVNHVMNITDVGHLTSDSDEGDDKIERQAILEFKTAWEIADFYTQAFKENLAELNIIEPNIWSKATDHIPEQIELIKKLEEKGYTYQISDGIYFDTSKFKNYCQLARLNLAGQEDGFRVGINAEKRNQTDFSLWKFSPKNKTRQMEWESPWGKGFPGWHIECSAMSMKYLGETIDIHTGGIDHIPVHHSNEIAQSECATGKKFVNYWLHSDFLVLNETKMSKSAGNFVTLETLSEEGFEPIVYRFFCLTAHYRSKLNFSWDAIAGARNSWEKFRKKFLDLGQQVGTVSQEHLTKFIEIINDDLAMPKALAYAWEIFKADLNDFDRRVTLLEFDKVLGLGLKDLKASDIDIPVEITKLADERLKAREAKKFAKADQYRKKIEESGWLVDDEVIGYTLKQK